MPILKYTHPGLAAYAFHHIDHNDKPHTRPHIYTVLENAAGIAEAYNLDPVPLELAAVLHDIYSGRNRKDHHGDACRFARDALFAYDYDYTTAERVSEMCRDHRASCCREYVSLYTMAFSAADRGVLDINQSMIRAFGYYNPNNLISDKQIMNLVSHLNDKFGVTGYARKNIIHEDYFAGNLQNFWEQLKTPIPQIRRIWELTKPSPLTVEPARNGVIFDSGDEITKLTYVNEETMRRVCNQIATESHFNVPFSKEGMVLV